MKMGTIIGHKDNTFMLFQKSAIKFVLNLKNMLQMLRMQFKSLKKFKNHKIIQFKNNQV